MNKDTAIALCRVSTVKQSMEGSSLEAQENRINELAFNLGVTIEKFWSLSVSSKKGNNIHRKDLNEMLDYAKHHKRVKYVIIDEPDRFMRGGTKEFYYMMGRFEFEANTQIIFAKKPHLSEDNMMSEFEQFTDVMRAKTENDARSSKTTMNMQMRIKLGFYPGHPKRGYKVTTTPGLHEPSEPQWSLIRDSFLSILEGATVKSVVHEMNAKGYKSDGGKPMDLAHFKIMLKDPFYAGTVKMNDWQENPNGLHKAMITQDQHLRLCAISNGVQYKSRRKFRPEFCLSNLMECTDCVNEHTAKYPRLVGYNHNNGKSGDRRKTYARYKCRNCKANILRDDLHNMLADKLDSLELNDAHLNLFKSALRNVWEKDTAITISRAKSLETRLIALREERANIVRKSFSSNLDEESIQDAVASIDKDIAGIDEEIQIIGGVEKDFIGFVEFSLSITENLRDNFWSLDAEHMRWCKQLLFPEGFSVSRDKKVYTPKVSEFYRLIATQKDSEESSIANMVSPRVLF